MSVGATTIATSGWLKLGKPGRKPKYSTEEERLQRQRQQRMEYYYRNADERRQKRRERYWRQKAEEEQQRQLKPSEPCKIEDLKARLDEIMRSVESN
jgi:hypothetical protein